MSDSDDDVPLGARVSAAQAPAPKSAAPSAALKPAAAPVPLPPQRQAAPRQSLADDSDDDITLAAKFKLAGKQLAVKVKKEEVEVKKEPQSAAEVAPGAVKREEAVKEAVQQLQREADANASAKKQAAAKESGGKPRTPRAPKSPKGAGTKAKVAVKREADGKGGAKKATGGRAAVKQEGGAVKEGKVYEKLGQKRETPETTDPLRIFYTTTFEQIAALKDNNGRPRNSEMSEKWLLEHGLLPDEFIDRAYKKYGRAAKAAAAKKKPASNSGVKRKGDSSSVSSAKKAKTSSGSAKKGASNGSVSRQGAKAAAKTPAAKPKPGGGTSTSSKGAGAGSSKPPPKRQSSGGSGSKAALPAKRPKKAVFSDSDSDDDVPLGQRAT